MPTALNLPQYAPNQAERQKNLERMRKAYAYTMTYKGKIATVNKLPRWEKPGLYYYWRALLNMAGLVTSLPLTLWKLVRHKWLGAPFKSPQDYIFFPFAPYPDRAFREDFQADRYLGLQLVAGDF